MSDAPTRPTRGVLRQIFWSVDFVAGVLAFFVSFWAATRSAPLRESAVSIFIAEGAIAVALLAVALTALAILVGLLGPEYVLILENVQGKVKLALLPYQVVAVVSSLTILLSFGAAVALKVEAPLPVDVVMTQALALGVSVGLTVWGIVGTVQLVNLTAFHGVQRARLIRGLQEARRAAFKGEITEKMEKRAEGQ